MKKSDRNGNKTAAAPRVRATQTDEGPRGREARKLEGKALRGACTRASLTDVSLGKRQRDPLGLIDESDRDRVAQLLPIRFTRMTESAFAFFRGSAIVQAHDLKGTPSS